MSDVLVIDDHTDSGNALARLLRHAGLDAAHEGDPIRALALMTIRPPRLVILDWMMPLMSGGDVLRVMQQDERLKRVKVIVFTAGDVSIQNDAKAAGAFHVLRKGAVDGATVVENIIAALNAT